MRHLRIAAAALALAALVGGASVAQEFDLPEPIPTPAGQPHVPEGEKQFMIWGDVMPGVRVWRQWLAGNVWHYATTQSVGDGAGMYIYAPPGKPVGNMCAVDTGVVKRGDQDDFSEFKGISLWIRGDGSEGAALISTGYSGSKMKFRIPLKDDKWHKVHMAWEKWSEPVTGPFWFINFGLERTDHAKASWYIVDRVHLYKEAKTEDISPTPDKDPPGMLPARAFVKDAEHIARTLEKLKAKKPVKIVVAGDSISCGAQLGYANQTYKEEGRTYNRRFFFWVVMAERLKEHFGYDRLSLLHRVYDKKTDKWIDTAFDEQGADLSVVAVATGGFQSTTMAPHLEQILELKPDLVLWQLGANDFVYGSTPKYQEATRAAVDRFKAAGIEVALHTPTPGTDRIPWQHIVRSKGKLNQDRGVDLADAARAIAIEKKCALADMHAAFTSRGVIFLGDLYCDTAHPNHLGHEMMADVLDALLTERDVKIWKHGPAAERVRADQK